MNFGDETTAFYAPIGSAQAGTASYGIAIRMGSMVVGLTIQGDGTMSQTRVMQLAQQAYSLARQTCRG
jgi:hypothetical protein